jgi:RNA polymerase sigma factor (sigma-70 family)
MRRDTENGSKASSVYLTSLPNSLTDQLFVDSGAPSWGVTREAFASALERSAQKHFPQRPVTSGKLEDYLRSLHLQDLALACACAYGSAAAWEHFVASYRPYLRSAAAAILRASATSPAACDLADSLFAELYGLSEAPPVTTSPSLQSRSLFRYFHGRSSLKTWLRAVLAQRHIDSIRAGRRFTELEPEDSVPQNLRLTSHLSTAQAQPADPRRECYLALFARTLQVALGLLDPEDTERLRLYYVQGQTLAEIARRFGEHESSVSRSLERIRRALRLEIEQALRKGRVAANGLSAQPGLSDAEISLCFQYAAEDVPIDFDQLFPHLSQPTNAERKDP